jgi:hypothetical protein
MNKTICAALAVLMLAALLGGCQLAIPEGEASGQDVLCGVFITLEYLDISEPEITINWKGEPEFSYAEARIYATRTKDENGHPSYAFDGVVGFRLFSVIQGEGNEAYKMTVSDGSIQQIQASYINNDVSLTGTICFDVHANCEVYANPVYQTPDGQVYATPGEGLWFDTIFEGDVGSTTLSATNTQTVNGETTTSKNEVTISITGSNTNQLSVLKQMDENDQVISQTEITQDNIPESIRIQPDCAYMLHEEHGVDSEGKTTIKRTLLNTEEQYFNVGFTGDNGIVMPYAVTLEKSVTSNT